MKSRTKARSVALQALYEIDISGHQPAAALEERLADEPLDHSLAEFARQIVFGVLPIVQKLDDFIAQHAPEWPMDQVAVIDRNILRIALWEFAVSGVTPIKVAINEAIEMAKIYGSDSTPRFVNGVLGSLASRQDEIQNAFGKPTQTKNTSEQTKSTSEQTKNVSEQTKNTSEAKNSPDIKKPPAE